MANPPCSPPTFGKRGEDRILGPSRFLPSIIAPNLPPLPSTSRDAAEAAFKAAMRGLSAEIFFSPRIRIGFKNSLT
jgi:hypothetical protein